MLRPNWIIGSLAGLALAIVSGVALQQSVRAAEKLSRADKQWMEKDVSSLITKREASTFESLASSQRERFKELFWARRDSDPATADNEFIDTFNSRVRIADQYFRARGSKGSLTDMGKIFTLLGQPSQRAHGRSSSAASAELASGGGIQDSLEGSTNELLPPGQQEQRGGSLAGSVDSSGQQAQGPQGRFASWIYSPQVIGGNENLELKFRAMPGFGYRLIRNGGQDEILDTLKASLVSRPDINYEVDEAGDLLPVATSFVSTATAVLDELVLTNEPNPGMGFFVDSAFFRSTEGSVYMPLLFELEPNAATFSDGEARLTFFGAITDLDGREFYRFEETARFGEKDNPLRFELPLQLPSGDFSVYLGVVDEEFKTSSGEASPRFGTKVTTLSVPDYSAGSASFSSVLLYKQATEATGATGPGNAFQFGRMRLNPIGRQGFDKSESLGLFYYLYGLEESTAPISAQYVFFLDGEEVAQTAEEVIPRSGDHAVGAIEIPMANFAPGSYRVLIRVRVAQSEDTHEKWFSFELDA